MQKSVKIYFLACCTAFLGCREEEKKSYSEQEIAAESEKLNSWLDAQFEEEVADSPQFQTSLGRKTNYDKWDDISSEKLAEDLDRNKERLEYLTTTFDTVALDSSAQLSYKIYKLNLDNAIEDYEYRFYNYPVNQMFGLHTTVPTFLMNKHRIDSLADAEAYIMRIKRVKPLFEALRNQLTIRESNQIVPPKFVLNRVLEDCQNIIKGQPFDDSSEKMPVLADFETKIADLDIDAAKKCEIACLTVPYAHQEDILRSIEDSLKKKILIDATVPLIPPKTMRVQLPQEGSAALRAQLILGESTKVISAFQNISAELLQSNQEVDCDVLVTGNNFEARSTVISLVNDAGLKGWHAGPLCNSVAAEALTSVLISINKKHSIDHSGIKITGI